MILFQFRTYRMWEYPKMYNVPRSFFMELPEDISQGVPKAPENCVYLSPLLSNHYVYIGALIERYRGHPSVLEWWQNLPKADRGKPAEFDLVLCDSGTACQGKPLQRTPTRRGGVVSTGLVVVVPLCVATYSGPEDFHEAEVWGRYIAEQVVLTLQTALGLPPAPQVGFLEER